jgi:hypothetical protein
MANTNKPFGFRWLGLNPGGGAVSFQLIKRKIAYGDTSAVYRGDPMQHLNTGYVSKGAAGVAVSQHAGILYGVEYMSNALGRVVFSEYWPGADASSDVTALLIPIANAAPQLFVAQATSTVFTFADIGMNCDISMGTGSVVGGHATSGATIDRSTIHTTTTLPFRIVDLYSSIAAPGSNGIDDTASYNHVIVQSNPFSATGL